MYQFEELEEYRTRKVFSLFPFIFIKSHSYPIWTGKWFKFIEIKEQKIKERYSNFDDGWSYQEYWEDWKNNYIFVELIKY